MKPALHNRLLVTRDELLTRQARFTTNATPGTHAFELGIKAFADTFDDIEESIARLECVEREMQIKKERWGNELVVDSWFEHFTQEYYSGGWNVSPETRLLLFSLAVALRAENIVELGYDAGTTFEAMALSGARHVVGLDNLTEYPGAETWARERLTDYQRRNNSTRQTAELLIKEVVQHLCSLDDNSVDLVHADDSHVKQHVEREARELRRVLRPGGMVLFHNDGTLHLWDIMADIFSDWGWIRLPAVGAKDGHLWATALTRKPIEQDRDKTFPDHNAIGLGEAMLERFRQDHNSGGIHTPPEMRLLMLALCKGLRAEFVVETGYDAGGTTEALAMSGAARVLAVDDLGEYETADEVARERLSEYENVELRIADALQTLKGLPDDAVDFIFIDDDHSPVMVEREIFEVRRVLRPGGIAMFHDTLIYDGPWFLIEKHMGDWQRINLPAISPLSCLDYGMGLVRKPTT